MGNPDARCPAQSVLNSNASAKELDVEPSLTTRRFRRENVRFERTMTTMMVRISRDATMENEQKREFSAISVFSCTRATILRIVEGTGPTVRNGPWTSRWAEESARREFRIVPDARCNFLLFSFVYLCTRRNLYSLKSRRIVSKTLWDADRDDVYGLMN